MNLNIPDTRQEILVERLREGSQLIAQDLAEEFDVSLDTIRRDILALEANGKARRVRGGAVPLAEPASTLLERLSSGKTVNKKLIKACIAHIGEAATLLVDGGTTTLSVISALPKHNNRLIMTPSPWVAIAAQERGMDVFLLGGKLSTSGGIVTGDQSLKAVQDIAADIALLGVCGLDAEFGLSSDDYAEAMMKQAMHKAAARTIIIADHTKINTRARHRTLPLNEIDLIITDANEDQTGFVSETSCKLELV